MKLKERSRSQPRKLTPFRLCAGQWEIPPRGASLFVKYQGAETIAYSSFQGLFLNDSWYVRTPHLENPTHVANECAFSFVSGEVASKRLARMHPSWVGVL